MESSKNWNDLKDLKDLKGLKDLIWLEIESIGSRSRTEFTFSLVKVMRSLSNHITYVRIDGRLCTTYKKTFKYRHQMAQCKFMAKQIHWGQLCVFISWSCNKKSLKAYQYISRLLTKTGILQKWERCFFSILIASKERPYTNSR